MLTFNLYAKKLQFSLFIQKKMSRFYSADSSNLKQCKPFLNIYLFYNWCFYFIIIYLW